MGGEKLHRHNQFLGPHGSLLPAINQNFGWVIQQTTRSLLKVPPEPIRVQLFPGVDRLNWSSLPAMGGKGQYQRTQGLSRE